MPIPITAARPVASRRGAGSVRERPFLGRRRIEPRLRTSLAAVAALVVLFGQGCASVPAGTGTVKLDTPCDDCLPGVRNFAKVSPALWRGSQPTAEGFRELERAGARTVIDCRLIHNDRRLLAGTKLKYFWIRMTPLNPTEGELVRFFRVIQDPANQPVFIHCWKGNDRSGFCVAAYRMLVDRWTADDAIREMFRFHFFPAWWRITWVLRHLDIEKFRAEIAAPPPDAPKTNLN